MHIGPTVREPPATCTTTRRCVPVENPEGVCGWVWVWVGGWVGVWVCGWVCGCVGRCVGDCITLNYLFALL